MKPFDYLMMFKDDVDFDIPDNEIDMTITVCFVKENAKKISEDYPYMDKFTIKLLKSVDICYLRSDGCPICDFSKIINDHIDLFKKFVKKYWAEDYQCYLEQDAIDAGEFAYQFIKEFDNVVGGRYGESMNKAYFKLLDSCQISELS